MFFFKKIHIESTSIALGSCLIKMDSCSSFLEFCLSLLFPNYRVILMTTKPNAKSCNTDTLIASSDSAKANIQHLCLGQGTREPRGYTSCIYIYSRKR